MLFNQDLNVAELYSQDGKGFEAIVYVRVFSPNGWEWFITEWDKNKMLFGYVIGFEEEWGNIYKPELEDLINKGYAFVDNNFVPKKLKDCI